MRRLGNSTSAAADRLTAMMNRTAGVGPWPEAASVEAKAELVDPTRRPMLGTRISARLGALSVRMVATASATYARMGLGSVEARVLLTLSQEPRSSSQIGKIIGVDRAAVCRAVQSLLERDLVSKLDGRERVINLTHEGAALIQSVNQISAERERRLLAGFGDEDVAVLLGFLGRLMLNVPALTELAESRVFEDPCA